MKKIIVYTHSDCLLKDNGPNHPEKKERVQIILKSIQNISSIDIDIKNAPLADVRNIYLVHPSTHINNIFSLIPNSGLTGIEKEPYADTLLCPKSKKAILRSCGAGIAAADSLIRENEKRIFCAVRPPGHHAETVRANGFCFINNVAVTAKYLQYKYKINKIAIIDFDVHHGNGTQHIFEEDSTVLYVSLHRYPFYPGTGSKDETGRGKGLGMTINYPLDANTGDDFYLDIVNHSLSDKVLKFQPDFIILSSGFDAHEMDPLGGMNVTTQGFGTMTEIFVKLAEECCGGRVLSVLEGGYNLKALAESVEIHLRKLSGIIM